MSLESAPKPITATIYPKSRLEPKTDWQQNEVIAVTTTPPTTFEALEKYPMSIVRKNLQKPRPIVEIF